MESEGACSICSPNKRREHQAGGPRSGKTRPLPCRPPDQHSTACQAASAPTVRVALRLLLHLLLGRLCHHHGAQRHAY